MVPCSKTHFGFDNNVESLFWSFMKGGPNGTFIPDQNRIKTRLPDTVPIFLFYFCICIIELEIRVFQNLDFMENIRFPIFLINIGQNTLIGLNKTFEPHLTKLGDQY